MISGPRSEPGVAGGTSRRSVQLTATPFEIDLGAACLRKDGAPVWLRPKTWKLLIYLAEHAGELVTKDDILDTVWAGSSVVEEVISASVSELRRAFEEVGGESRFIQTVHRRGYRFVAPLEAAVAASGEPAALFVSRHQELAHLNDAADKASQSQRQLVLISGEAGIGKTTLVQRFLQELIVRRPAVIAATGQCFEEFRGEEPFCPVLDVLAELARLPLRDEVRTALRTHAPSWLLQVPSLVHVRERSELLRSGMGETHDQRVHNLVQAIDTLCADRLLVLIIEDFHWSDAATADFVMRLAARPQPARLLLLCTQRPEETRARPFAAKLDELVGRRRGAKIDMPRLSDTDMDQYLAERFAGAAVPQPIGRWFHRQTDGNPLFMVNVADELIRRQIIREQDAGWVFDAEATGFQDIPESLRSIIEQRCNALSAEERPVLEAAGIAGVRFTDAAVEAAAGAAAGEHLAILARQRMMIDRVGDSRWPDGTAVTNYVFQHAMYRDALRDGIPARRRVEWHQRIGNRMETGFASDPVAVAADLVEHFDQGLEPARSANYLVTLGVDAVQRFAYADAGLYFRNAFERVRDLQGYDEYKLFLLRGLATASLTSTGYGSEECGGYLRQIRDMIETRGDDLDRGWLIGVMAGWHALRGEHRASIPLAEELVALSYTTASEHFFLWGRFAAAMENAWAGSLQRAVEHYRAGAQRFDELLRERTDPNMPPEAKILGICGAAIATFLIDPDAAFELIDEAHRYSRDQIHHPFGRLMSAWFESLFHALLGHFGKAYTLATEDIAGVDGHAMPPFADLGRIVAGWAQTMQGDVEGVKLMEVAWRTHQAHIPCGPTICLLLLAEARHKAGQQDAALTAVNEALEYAERNNERLFEPELLGLRAELIMQQPSAKGQQPSAKGQHPRAKGQQPGAKGERLKRARADLDRAHAVASEHGMQMWLTRTAARTAKLFAKA